MDLPGVHLDVAKIANFIFFQGERNGTEATWGLNPYLTYAPPQEDTDNMKRD